jgi:hypothetical protein
MMTLHYATVVAPDYKTKFCFELKKQSYDYMKRWLLSKDSMIVKRKKDYPSQATTLRCITMIACKKQQSFEGGDARLSLFGVEP